MLKHFRRTPATHSKFLAYYVESRNFQVNCGGADFYSLMKFSRALGHVEQVSAIRNARRSPELLQRRPWQSGRECALQ